MGRDGGKSSVGTSELAAILGISRQRVNELGRLGKIPREADGRWNPDRVEAALKQNLDHRQSTVTRGGQKRDVAQKIPPAPTGDTVPLQKGTIAYETYRLTKEKADRAELEREEAEGRLIKAETVEQKWAEVGARVKDEVSALATRIVQQLPDEWRREVFRIASAESRRALTVIADEFGGHHKAA